MNLILNKIDQFQYGRAFCNYQKIIFLIILLSCSCIGFSQNSLTPAPRQVTGYTPTISINSSSTLPKFQDSKRAVVYLHDPWTLGIPDPNDPKIDAGSTATLINTVRNTYNNNKHELYLLMAQHNIHSKLTNDGELGPTDGQEVSVGDRTRLFLSFDYESSNGSSDLNINSLAQFSVSQVWEVNCTYMLVDFFNDITLLRIDFIEGDAINLKTHKAFINSYVAGWNLHPDYLQKNFNNISHPNRSLKKIYQNYNGEIVLSNYNGSPSEPENEPIPYNFIGTYNDKWGNNAFGPEGGSSGSSLMDKNGQVFATLLDIAAKKTYWSLLQNAWIDNYDDLAENTLGLITYLDPQATWISQIKGGYLKDLIPNEASADDFFNLTVDNIPPKSLALNALDFFRFQSLPTYAELLLADGVLPADSNPKNDIIMYLTPENEASLLLYGVTYENDTNQIEGIFKGTPWGFAENPFNIANFPTNEVNLNYDSFRSNDIRNSILLYMAGDYFNDLNEEQQVRILSNFNFSAKLNLKSQSNTGQVRAVKLPYQMPYNAKELFETEINPITGEIIFDPYANLWQSYKYHPNRFNGQNLNIKSITLKNWDKPLDDRTGTDLPIVNRTITTENNGGYLNLVNPNYSFSPVELSWEDPKDATNSKDRFIELEIKLNKNITGLISFKVWIDYFNRDSFLGRNVSDKTYNFVFDEIQNHPSELLVSSANIDANTTVNQPDDQTILINAKLPPIGIGPNNSYIGKKRLRIAVIEGATPPLQNLINNALSGEVEDYLIDLVPPSDALNIEEQLAELLKNTGNIRLKKRKKSGDQNPTCNQGDETGEQLYDETGPEDNMGNQRTCSIWEGPCVSADDCALLYQQNTDAAGGELINLSGDNFVHVDRNGTYTKGNFDNGFTALTTYSPSNPFCENCDSEYILKQGSIQGDNDGDGGGDGDGDGWGIRLNPDAEDPEIELEVDVNNQQEIISVPLDEWLAQDPNQKFDIMVKKEQRKIALMVRSQSTNTYDEEEMILNTSVMNITQKTTLGGGVSQVYNNTNGTIDDLIFIITPTTNEEDKIIFENATETTITYNKSNSTVGKDNNINTTKLNTETEDQPDFSLYPNPAKDKINILLEVRQEGPLYIDIFDMSGRQVYSINRPSITQGHQLITLPVQNLSAGNYIVKIRAGDVLRSEKIVIE